MANMGYCRFRNTARDLADCVDHMADDDLSMEEHAARKRMVKTMVRILNDMGASIDFNDLDELPDATA